MTILAAEPILAVRDIARSVAYYRDALGFEREWTYLDPPVHAGISIGTFQIQFTLNAGQAERCAGAELFVRVDDVRASLAAHGSRGVAIASPLANKPWGVAEYSVRDPDGYVLRFAGAAIYERLADAPASLPSHYRVEVRTPNVADFARLKTDVGWELGGDLDSLAGVLARSLYCVVATDARSGEAVGMLRVDGHGRQFTIWDVMVRPADQHRRVGAELVGVAITHLRTLAPAGSFVGLFSMRPAFYERLGFTHEGGLHLRL